MLTTAELAARQDFRLGEALVSPSTRTVSGPGGQIDVEPRVMQVLVVLADAAGHVVTRDMLFSRCWGVAYVGDDSLNRAVAGVRRIAETIGTDSFTVDTVRRTGYRLVVRSGVDPSAVAQPDAWRLALKPPTTRRVVISGAAVVAMGGAGYWWLGRDRTDPRVARLIADGKRILIDAWPDTEQQAVEAFSKAVALDPKNAEAWGLLAYAYGSALEFQSPETARAASQSEQAARTALAIDPREPYALLARRLVQRGMLGRYLNEDEYRRILAIHPDNVLAMRSLAQLLQSVGRCLDSSVVSERAIALYPLSPDLQARNAMRQWVLGRNIDADRISDRTMQLWPSHRLVRMVRLMLYAFTGRPRAALAIVEDEEASPHLLSPAAATTWRLSLEAMEKRTSSTIAAARQANLEASKTTPASAAYGILILSALNELDAAFEVANGFLLARGSVIVRPKPTAKVPSVNNIGWRNTMGLFTPPTKPMRLDPRFQQLADGLGLTEYWRKRGIGPDAFLFKA